MYPIDREEQDYVLRQSIFAIGAFGLLMAGVTWLVWSVTRQPEKKRSRR